MAPPVAALTRALTDSVAKPLLEGAGQAAEWVGREGASAAEQLGEITGFHGTQKLFDEFLNPEALSAADRNWGRPNVWLGTHFTTDPTGALDAGMGGRVIEAQIATGKVKQFADERELDRAISSFAAERRLIAPEEVHDPELIRSVLVEGSRSVRNARRFGTPEELTQAEERLAEARRVDLNYIHHQLLSGSEDPAAPQAALERSRRVGLAFRQHLQEQGYGAVGFDHPLGPTIVPFDVSQIRQTPGRDIFDTIEAFEAKGGVPARLPASAYKEPTPVRGGKVVGFAGYSRTGKDAAADVLVEKHGYQRLQMSAPLMREALARNPDIGGRPLSSIVDEIGWERAKDEVPEVRPLLVGIGNEWRAQHGPDVLTRMALEQADPSQNYVVTGLRFQGEIDKINEMGGSVLRVNRPGVGPANESETQIAALGGVQDIANDRTMRVLHTRTERAALGPRDISAARRQHLEHLKNRTFIDDPVNPSRGSSGRR